jgi:hypothetical protein
MIIFIIIRLSCTLLLTKVHHNEIFVPGPDKIEILDPDPGLPDGLYSCNPLTIVSIEFVSNT